MKYLFLNQYYPPDLPPTGWVLHDLAQRLVSDGHEVRVVCSRRSYAGGGWFSALNDVDGIYIHRVRAFGFGRKTYVGKFLDYFSYYMFLFMYMLFMRWKPDVILSMTTPPFLGLLGKLFACLQGCRHAHWIMDLYPDVLSANRKSMNGEFYHKERGSRRKTWLIRVLEWVTRFMLKGSCLTLAIGPDMAMLVSRYVAKKKGYQVDVPWVPLWGDSNLFPWSESEKNSIRDASGVADKLVLMYSGNMGLGHRFVEFLDASEKTHDDVCWVFAGGGKRRLEIEEFCREHPNENIKLLPYAPFEKLREHLCSADVHLISMDGSWKGCVVPSKLQGSFGVGVPVIFVGPEDSSIAHWVSESGGGWIVAENDIPSLLKAIDEAKDSVERKKRGVKAREYAEKYFDVNLNCRQITELLNQCS
ncbi:MAG: glycosyltransferase family 4 protein [Kiritimatiellae bacterium]|nr:glycosyltransferase family 4 protein [Kiritimatiellia bacterium]